MAEAARRLATYDDLLALPEEVRGELVDGRIVLTPSGLPEHGYVQGALGAEVGSPFGRGRGGPGGWWILLEVDVRLSPHDVVRPDVAGWRRERLPAPWGVRPIDVVPDWVCEVLSPSTASFDRRDKKRLYGAHGVAFYWLIDPATRLLEAYGREGPKDGPWRWVEHGTWGPEDRARIPPFEAREIDVAALFPPTPPAGDEPEP